MVRNQYWDMIGAMNFMSSNEMVEEISVADLILLTRWNHAIDVTVKSRILSYLFTCTHSFLSGKCR